MREVTTPIGFLSYPKLKQAEAYMGKGEPKFRAQIVVVRNVDGESAKEQLGAGIIPALRAAAEEKWADKVPPMKELMLPVGPVKERDVETFGDPGALVIKATNKAKPALFDSQGNRLDPEDPTTYSQWFYPGCFARLRVWSFAWESGRKGVSLVLQGVQHVGDGEPIGSSSTEITMDAVAAPPGAGAGEAWEPGEEESPGDDSEMPF